ncbi:MAG: ZIP family zinc transporter, partial [Desertimonas sp.]
ALGYALLDPTGGNASAFAQAFAAGALLTMVADTMLPEAFDVEGMNTGWLVAIGFACSIILSGF